MNGVEIANEINGAIIKSASTHVKNSSATNANTASNATTNLLNEFSRLQLNDVNWKIMPNGEMKAVKIPILSVSMLN
jgi:hypothetical protein